MTDRMKLFCGALVGGLLLAAGSGVARAGGSDCCDTPCIVYRDHCRCCCDCEPRVPAVLKVTDCCCCCPTTVDVPVCLPACAKGTPCVSSCCGAFGRSIVRYQYDGGFLVTVVFRARGDILVTYRDG